VRTGRKVISTQPLLTQIQVRYGQRVVLLVHIQFQVIGFLYWTIVLCIGHVIVDVCIIFRIMPSHRYSEETLLRHQITSCFLTYVRRYDIVNQQNTSANSSCRGVYSEWVVSLSGLLINCKTLEWSRLCAPLSKPIDHISVDPHLLGCLHGKMHWRTKLLRFNCLCNDTRSLLWTVGFAEPHQSPQSHVWESWDRQPKKEKARRQRSTPKLEKKKER